VESDEREATGVVIETHRGSPSGFFMATLAACAELAAVSIVLPMAALAIVRQRIAQVRSRVTALAGECGMLPAKRESGPRSVVEHGPIPPLDAVTIAALRATAASVYVIDTMTVAASARRTLELAIRMTGGTRGFRMGPEQPEAGHVVIEAHMHPREGYVAM